jgi:hypothetical protein
MKRMIHFTVLVCLAGPAAVAEDTEAPGLMERGAQQFLEGLLKEMEPALKGMEDFVAQMGPALTELMREVEDWANYLPPEVLPNGDIIIRRKPQTVPTPQEPDIAPQVDL